MLAELQSASGEALAEQSARPSAGVVARGRRLSLGETAVRLYGLLARFERTRVRALTIAVAIVLVAPALASGFSADDYLLLNGAVEPGPHGWAGSAPFDLFHWTDAEHTPLMMDGHGLSWWVHPETRIAFMRPVSSLTHALDNWLWPGSALAMHVHNLLWFALLLVVAATAYAALIDDRWIAGVATAMFALDAAHGFPVGWIANRNALLGGVFGIAALLLHHRRRKGAAVWVGAYAWACFAFGLLSCELAIGAAGSLAAYALFVERGAWRARLRSIAPYAGLALAWAAARGALGYGVVGLGSYVDPIREPLAFLRALPGRAVVLLSSQIWRLVSDVVHFMPPVWQLLLVGFNAALLLLAVWLVWPRGRSPRAVLFWASCALFGVVPIAAGAPSERLLLLVGFAVAPLVAQAMHAALRAPGDAPELVWRRGFAVILAGLHFVVDPCALPVAALVPAGLASVTQSAAASLPTDAHLADKTVIVAAVPDSVFVTYLMAMRAYEGLPRPARFHWLTASTAPVRLERRGPSQLRVTAPDGVFSARWDERNERLPLHRGERVELSELSVTVLEVSADGRPTVCDFTFARPLESSSYLWVTWRDQRLVPINPPREGETVTQ